MKIASWNINSLRKRQDRLFAWLENTKPDIVCLQETKCPDEQFPVLALQAAGYHSAYHGEKSYNGVAILSKTNLRDVRASLCDEVVDPQARVIAATIDNLRVYSIYAPNGQAVGSPAYDYKLKLVRAAARLFGQRKRCRSCRVRRFQCRAGRYRYLRPRALARRDHVFGRRARSVSAIVRSRFVDTLRLHHKEGGLFSWWDYRMLSFPKNRGLRIDAILASKSLAKKCTAAGNRPRNAQRKRTFRSRAGLGRI